MSVALENIPTVKSERWKYTNLPPAVKDFSGEISKADIVHNAVDKTVQDLGTLLSNPPPWLDTMIKRTPSGAGRYGDMYLWDLGNENLHEGLVVDVPVGKSVEKHLEINVTGHDQGFYSPRMIIRLGEAASLTIIERRSGSGHYWNNQLTQIIVGKGAHLRHILIQDDSKDAVYTQNTHVEIERDGSYEAFAFTAGGKMSRNQAQFDLNGENAHCRLYGVNLLKGAQHGDTTFEVLHKAPHGQSEQFYRSVLDDRARAVFQGKVMVEKGAHHTDAQQLSNALLLSEGAEMDTKPELEIYDDDVQCAHGATTGQLNDEALFYMRTRGISEKEARDVLIKAFVDELVDKFGDDAVKSLLQEKIEGVL